MQNYVFFANYHQFELKNVATIDNFVMTQVGVVEQTDCTYSNNALIISRDIQYKSLFQREIAIKKELYG